MSIVGDGRFSVIAVADHRFVLIETPGLRIELIHHVDGAVEVTSCPGLDIDIDLVPIRSGRALHVAIVVLHLDLPARSFADRPGRVLHGDIQGAHFDVPLLVVPCRDLSGRGFRVGRGCFIVHQLRRPRFVGRPRLGGLLGGPSLDTRHGCYRLRHRWREFV